jgi:protein-tyrosine phosphatase
MTQIWERFFLGSLVDAQRLAKVNPYHIDTVISLSEISVETKRPGVNYVHLPIEDDRPVPVGKFDSVMDAIAENVRWGTILVYCGFGISRAPTLTAAWMHVVGYKNIDAAMAEIGQMRPMIDPSKILLDSVKEHLQ